MAGFGERPDTQFPEKITLDGTEHIYSQEGGNPVFFTLERSKDWILSQNSFDLFDIVNTDANLPTGGSINPDKIYIVRNYLSTGKTASLVYDSTISNWRSISQTDNPFVIVNNIPALPPTGNSDKIYHVLDGGNTKPRLMRWNSAGSQYIDLDQDNHVYQISNVAARDALTGMQIGNVCIMTDADGSGNKGVSWYTGSAWTLPLIQSNSPSSGILDVTVATVSTTLTTSHRVVIVYSSSAPVTITLPSATTSEGVPFTIKAGNLVNPIIIATVSGNIDGSSTKSFANALESFNLISDGTNYFLI